MRDERGMALPLTLLILLVLSSLTMAIVMASSTEPVIARNLADGSQARFAAEAGLEFAYNQLAATPDWDTTLAAADGFGNVTLAAAANIPTTNGAMGTYTVIVRNDNQVNDNTITGVPRDPGTNTDDQNAKLIVTAIGTVNGATRTIRTVITRAVLPPFPAALNFPGNEAQSRFNADAFIVDGNDWKMNGTPGTCAPAYGISVSPTVPANEGVVQTALSAIQKDNVMGKKQNPAGVAYGDNTIAPEPTLTPAVIQSFIDQAKKNADLVLNSNPPGLSYTDIGSSCAANWNSTSCWGTSAKPKIVYVKGAPPDPTSNFSALQTFGTTSVGHGILIVEDGDLKFNGDFTWYGPVIVTGQYVGIGFMGGGIQKIYGSIISNETRNDAAYYEGWISGNATLRYSCEAIDKMRSLKKLVTMGAWQEL